MNNDDVKVSVICLSYNHEKYIRKTLEGLVNQNTNFNYEIIVHDDFSTDKTVDIIREFEYRYPKLFNCIYQSENQYSQGIDILLECIVPKIKGKYIAICEGDDFWCDSNKLQIQYDVLEHNNSYGMCTHLVRCCNEDETANDRVIPEKYYKLYKNEGLSPAKLADLIWKTKGYPFHTSSYFIKTDTIKNHDILNWTNNSRDIDWLKNATLNGGILYLNKPMSVRRLGSIDGWNDRMRKGGRIAWINLNKKDIIADEKFDAFSNYEFHDVIAQSVMCKCFNIVDVDYEFVKERIDIIRGTVTRNSAFKYRLFSFSPRLVFWIKRIKHIVIG